VRVSRSDSTRSSQGLLYACHPSNLKFVMIDPKKIELAQYNRIVDHFIAMPEESDDPIITDFQQALGVLKSCEKEMESRYDLLAGASVRGIRDYNRKLAEGKLNRGRRTSAPPVHRRHRRRAGGSHDDGRQGDRGTDRAPRPDGARRRHPPHLGDAASFRRRHHGS
jgi:DNA segregation ATPase FtsK/SpoIIIE-like protein